MKNDSPFHQPPRQTHALMRRELRRQSSGSLSGIALASLIAVSGSLAADKKQAPVPTAFQACNLIETIATWPERPLKDGEIRRLDPEWVGTVRRVYFRDDLGTSKQATDESIRLTHLQSASMRPGGPPVLVIARARQTEAGRLSYRVVEAARFKSDLPKTEAIARATRLPELESIIGRQHGPGHVASWTFFSKEPNDQLRLLRVFAFSERLRGGKNDSIHRIEIQEGTFRPANPNSEEERRQFKSADDLANERRAALAAKDAKYPPPLRALIEARHTPDDSDLIAYTRALDGIRKQPDPLLFQQLVEHLDEDSVTFVGYLEAILVNDNFGIKLPPWKESERSKALRATMDVMNRVKTSKDLVDVVMTILYALGGAKMQIEIPNAGVRVDLECRRFSNGVRKSDGSSGMTEANLPVVIDECRKWLVKRYPELSKP